MSTDYCPIHTVDETTLVMALFKEELQSKIYILLMYKGDCLVLKKSALH